MTSWPIAAIVLSAAVALFVGGLGLFALFVRARGVPDVPGADRKKPTAIATRTVILYVLWLLGPVERALARAGVTPTAITLAGLVVSIGAGAAAAAGWFAAAGFLFAGAGFLDILDGRVARRTGTSSAAGAFIDSIADRWGEWALLAGAGAGIGGAPGFLAALACLAGSQMVSYTRARAEGLGIQLTDGLMQRSERLAILSVSLVVAELLAGFGLIGARPVLIGALTGVAILSTYTAIARALAGVRALTERARRPALRAVRGEAPLDAPTSRASSSSARSAP